MGLGITFSQNAFDAGMRTGASAYEKDKKRAEKIKEMKQKNFVEGNAKAEKFQNEYDDLQYQYMEQYGNGEYKLANATMGRQQAIINMSNTSASRYNAATDENISSVASADNKAKLVEVRDGYFTTEKVADDISLFKENAFKETSEGTLYVYGSGPDGEVVDKKTTEPMYVLSKTAKAREDEDPRVRLGSEERSTRWFDKEYDYLKKENPKEFVKKRREFIDQLKTKSTAGKGEVREDLDTTQLETAIQDGASLIAGNDKNKINKLKSSQRKILRNMTTQNRKSTTETRDALRNEHITIESLEDINTLVDKHINDDKFKTGLIDSTYNAIKKMTGITAEDKDVLGTIEVKTRVGFIKAMFVKAMSGATVSDKEQALYMDIFMGGDWSDETAAKATLSTLTETMKDYHLKRTEKVNDVLPSEYNNALKWKKKKDKQSTKSSIGSVGGYKSFMKNKNK